MNGPPPGMPPPGMGGGSVNATFPQCPQCKMFHPPVANGQCPMSPSKDNSGQIIDTGNFMNQLKVIVVDQINKKNIKDHKKLFGQVIVHLTQFLENYKE